jgi:hypothetical protein
MSKAKEVEIDIDIYQYNIFGGFTFYPYRFGFGCSVGYWPCIYRPHIRIYFGSFKLWASIGNKSDKGE